ncbi:MAG: glycosyltransferase family 25 protein [Chlamydiales bacterium]|nr:glycosyltransferase family 25 protein [Chlamydiales bacterium]
MRALLPIFALCFSSLHADIEDHFKPALNKSDVHKMKNIDFIYTINLDQRPEKFASCVEQLEPYGILPYRFSAVNGWELTLEQIDELGIKYEPWMTSGKWGTCYPIGGDGTPQHFIVEEVGKTYFSHCMSKGAIGIALSHLSILQDAYDSGYETIWVMEDDIEVIQNPHVLSDLIEKLDALVGKDGWDILFTDQDTKNSQGAYVPCSSYAWRPNFAPVNPYRFADRKDMSPDFRRIGSRYGAYTMIVRRSGMKKILRFFKNYHIFLPFDMEYTQPEGIRLFTVIDDVISTQPRALSDNGAPNYKKP